MNSDIILTIFDYADRRFDFNGLDEAHSFISDEIKFWTDIRDNIKINHNLLNSIQYLNSLLNAVQNAINNSNFDFKSFDNAVSNIKPELRTRWLWSNHPYTHVFLDICKKNGEKSADFFIKYVAKNQFKSITTRDDFEGAVQGFAYLNSDRPAIQIKEAEERSFNALSERLHRATNELIAAGNSARHNFELFNQNAVQSLENLKESFGNKFSSQIENNREYLEKEVFTFSENIKTLELTYQEKLRLEKPAEYWHKTAAKHYKQGLLFLNLFVLSIILAIIIFYFSFIEWLGGRQIGIQLNTVQGVIIFASLLACFAFYIKTISKITFSSFHLMRDAEEREQLVYLFLSLINENEIEESSRNIILQALFSRSETGLLSKESSPTMPSVFELIKMCNKP